MPTLSPLRLRLTIASLLIVSCLGALDHTVVATSLATIAGELDALQQMSWIIVAYSLSTTVLLPVLGKLGDLFGPRRVYLASVTGFVLASLACGFATTLTGLVLARVAQGVGGAGIQLMSQTLVAELTTPRQRPRYLSIIGASFPIAVLVGPVLGGLITDAWGWRWVFWINIPLGVVALLVAAVTIPTVTPSARRRFDLPGALAFALTVVPLVLALSWATEGDPGLRSGVAVAGVVAVAGLLTFVAVESRSPAPLVPPHFFRNRTVAPCLALSTVIGIGLFSLVSYLPTYIQMVYRTTATVSGLVPIATVFGMLVASLTTGFAASSTGRYRGFMVAGATGGALGLAGMSLLPVGMPLWAPMALMALVGIGTGAFMNLTVAVVQAAVTRTEIGAATATVNLVRQVGAAVGTTVVGALIGAGVTTLAPASLDPSGLTPELVRNSSSAVQAEVAQAYATTLSPVFLGLALVYLVGVVAALVLPPGRLPDEESHLSGDPVGAGSTAS